MKKYNKKGFTLVELLTIICIIGVIIGIAVPSVNKILKDGKKNIFINDAKTILKSTEGYLFENRINVPDEGIAFELLDLEFNTKNKYTGIVKMDESGDLVFDSITDNSLCGSGNSKTINVSDDLSNCNIIFDDNSDCFTMNEDGALTSYDKSCSSKLVIPTRINGEPVKSISDGLFVEDYDYLVGEYYGYDENGNYYEYYDIYDSFKHKNIEPVYSYPVKDIAHLKKSCYRNVGDEIYDLKPFDYVNTEYAYCNIIGSISPYKVDSIELESIDLSKAHYLEEIGDLAFYQNDATSIEFGHIENLRKIGNSVLENNSIEGLLDLSKLPNLTHIGSAAFNNGHIEDVILPDSLVEIGPDAFSYNSLRSVTFGEGLKKTGVAAFSWNEIAKVTLPSTITEISDESFYGNWDLVSVNLEDTEVEYIGKSAFSLCALKNITLPNTIKHIGDYAFDSMSTLESVNLPEGITYIGTMAFFQNKIKTFTLPSTLQYLGNAAFSDNQTENSIAFQYKLVDGVEDKTVLTGYSGKNRGTVNVPSTVTTIASHAFRGGPYTTINMSSVTKLEESAFLWAQLRNFPNIPNISEIPEWGFYACAFNTLVIPDYIKSIGDEAFHYSGIRNLTVPSTVTHIGNGAFNNNYVNKTFYARKADGTEDTTTIVSYANRYGQSNVYTIPSTVTTISPRVQLMVNNIPSTVTTIGEDSFNIYNPTSLTIPGSIKNIPNRSIHIYNYDIEGTNVVFGEGVERIGRDVFQHVFNPLTIIIPSTITYIDPEAFVQCEVEKIKINKPENKNMYGYPWGAREEQIEWIG